MTAQPYTARHLGWDYTVQQHRQETAAAGAIRKGLPWLIPAGRHAAYACYRIADPSTRLDMQMADEEATA